MSAVLLIMLFAAGSASRAKAASDPAQPPSASAQQSTPVAASLLPPGKGVEVVRFHCVICHNLDLVAAQRLSRDVWDEVLDDMRIFGAVFDDGQREVILDYLAAHLKP